MLWHLQGPETGELALQRSTILWHGMGCFDPRQNTTPDRNPKRPVQPKSIRHSQGPEAGELPLQRSATVVMRRAQRSVAGGASPSAVAAAALGVARMSRLASMRAPSLPVPGVTIEEGVIEVEEEAEAAAAGDDEAPPECSLPR